MPPTRKTVSSTPYPGQPTDVPSDRKAPRKRTARKKTSPSLVPPPGIQSPTVSGASSTSEGDARYAPTAWGSSESTGLEDLTVPSGQLCQVRRPGVEGLLKAGVLNDIDSLSAIVDDKHIRRATGQKRVDVNSLKLDTEMLDNVLHVTDRIVCYVVVQPHIEMAPNDVTRRQPGVIYADMVDITDKMFLLNYAVGGTRDLERFRVQLEETSRGVDNGEDVEGSTE